jgi:16S rRNA (cytidine1402-2'-O)-methyltransferase
MAVLNLVNLPIGNIGDLTPNARKALVEGKFFCVEDTRTFVQFMRILEIETRDKRIISFHDASERTKVGPIIDELEERGELYIASEAGSPIISDPAFLLVKEAIKRGIEIKTCSGITSLVAALELSGLPPHPFHFYGFFPRENKKQEQMASEWGELKGSICFFEAPSRVLKTLEYLTERFPLEEFAVCREMTKLYETVYRFQGANFSKIKEEMIIKGEFVILFYREGQKAKAGADELLVQLCQQVLEEGAKPKILAKILAQVLGGEVKDFYSKLGSR